MNGIPEAEVKGVFSVNGLTQEMMNRLGPVLHKALGDRHKYYCRLRTGERICFFKATFNSNYPDHITLIAKTIEPPAKDEDNGQIDMTRGLCVRIADIEWCVDFEK